jgi:uncharacterized protein (DUF2225 family)
MAAGEQSIHYQVHTCPHCGFTSEEIEDDDLSEDVKRFVRQNITPLLPKGDIPSWTKFEFMALIDENIGSDPYSLGMIYLHAAWCCYDFQHLEAEDHYRKKVIHYLTNAFETGDLDEDLIYMVPYLIGEQHRRVGNRNDAIQWYERVIEMEKENPDRDFFVSLALQQTIDPKDLMGEIIHQENNGE